MTDIHSDDDQSKMGFPAIPFIVLWPLIRLVAVPLIQAVLPTLLRKMADTLDSGQPGVISEEELILAIESQKDSMKAVYKGQ